MNSFQIQQDVDSIESETLEFISEIAGGDFSKKRKLLDSAGIRCLASDIDCAEESRKTREALESYLERKRETNDQIKRVILNVKEEIELEALDSSRLKIEII